MSSDRARIVACARSWIGTPYHHQAYVKGVAADCIGFVRGVYTEVTGVDPDYRPDYSPSWGDSGPDELLLDAGRQFFVVPDYGGWRAGDLLVFRVKNAVAAKHCAIAIDHENMIHAVSGRHVMQTGIGAWSSRAAGVFSFPGVK